MPMYVDEFVRRVVYIGLWDKHVQVELFEDDGGVIRATDFMGVLQKEVIYSRPARGARVDTDTRGAISYVGMGADHCIVCDRVMPVGPDVYDATEEYDPVAVLLAKMTEQGTHYSGIARSRIAELVLRTIECTTRCVMDNIRKTSDRTIGVALSGAAPGNPFDICLTSAV